MGIVLTMLSYKKHKGKPFLFLVHRCKRAQSLFQCAHTLLVTMVFLLDTLFIVSFITCK